LFPRHAVNSITIVNATLDRATNTAKISPN
jgi:hypothetical protein